MTEEWQHISSTTPPSANNEPAPVSWARRFIGRRAIAPSSPCRVFRVKAGGRFKAHLQVHGWAQQHGIDCFKTFAPVG